MRSINKSINQRIKKGNRSTNQPTTQQMKSANRSGLLWPAAAGQGHHQAQPEVSPSAIVSCDPHRSKQYTKHVLSESEEQFPFVFWVSSPLRLPAPSLSLSLPEACSAGSVIDSSERLYSTPGTPTLRRLASRASHVHARGGASAR